MNSMRNLGLAKKKSDGIRVLGRGELDVALHVKAAHVSEGAKKKIEGAGGTVVLDS